MKNYLATLIMIMVVLIAGCKKDDYEEIIGVCPVVLTTNPLNGASAVPLDQVIQVTFNEPMNAATFTSSSFIISGPNALSGTISYSGSTVTFTPSVNLKPYTLYTGRVLQTVKDVHGNALQQDYVWTFTTGAAGVELNSSNRFGLLAASGITSSGFGRVNNQDIGVSPAPRASITGFPPALVVDGEIYAANDVFPVGTTAMLTQAKQDLTTAYLFAESRVVPSSHILVNDLGGRTLTPGVYGSATSLLIQNGNLTLDAQGDENAFWIFKAGSDLVTIGGIGGDVLLINGAKAENVFWQVGSSATLGFNTSFKGNILALTSITLNPNATIDGRLFARNGEIVLSGTNIINKP